jgi:hypothetical protein
MVNFDTPSKKNIEEIAEIISFHDVRNVDETDEAIATALARILQSGGVDGDHHKAWVLDQVARILAGDAYPALVKYVKDGEDGPDTYGWDEGIPP